MTDKTRSLSFWFILSSGLCTFIAGMVAFSGKVPAHAPWLSQDQVFFLGLALLLPSFFKWHIGNHFAELMAKKSKVPTAILVVSLLLSVALGLVPPLLLDGYLLWQVTRFRP